MERIGVRELNQNTSQVLARVSGGWLTWDRFDVAGDVANVDKAFGPRGLTHRVTGHNLAELLSSGVLASLRMRGC